MKFPEAERVKGLIGRSPIQLTPLTGGCIADVCRMDFEDGEKLVLKTGAAGAGLDLEGYMLQYLASHSDLPVPEVLCANDDLLIMAYINAGSPLTPAAQEHAADLLASLHNVVVDRFGFEKDTVIGSLRQPNSWTKDWVEFFRDKRLIYMAEEAVKSGSLKPSSLSRIETLCAKLDRWLLTPVQASLIHGDMWGGNILCKDGRIAGFVDPAIYYADPEIELAFSTLFDTFGSPFFNRYAEHRPFLPGFFEERRDIYNLYPLLVHLNLFGGSYAARVEATLTRFGF